MPEVPLTNTYLPQGPGKATMERESLRDVVEMVALDLTPLYTNLTKVKATAIKVEWGTEDIGPSWPRRPACAASSPPRRRRSPTAGSTTRSS
jgi:hypothetical protein